MTGGNATGKICMSFVNLSRAGVSGRMKTPVAVDMTRVLKVEKYCKKVTAFLAGTLQYTWWPVRSWVRY